MRTVVILQPSLWPWLGCFEQIYQSDIFVFYCDVQWTTNDWRNRNRIKTAAGWQWITVPTLHHGKFGQRICDAVINNNVSWRDNHLKTLRQNYSKAPFFAEYFSYIEQFYSREWLKIEDIAEESIQLACKLMGLERIFFCSKNLGITGERSERLLNICRHFGATRYYSGRAAMGYLDLDIFQEAGIEVEFQDYHHPEYTQLYGGFISHLSILDLLFCEGGNSLDIITRKENQ